VTWRCLYPILLLAAMHGSSARAAEPPQKTSCGASSELICALTKPREEQLKRAMEERAARRERGPSVLAGYKSIAEGLTQEEVSVLFNHVAYGESQKICGQSSSGPVLCRERLYTGMIGEDVITAKITFLRDGKGVWRVAAWE